MLILYQILNKIIIMDGMEGFVIFIFIDYINIK